MFFSSTTTEVIGQGTAPVLSPFDFCLRRTFFPGHGRGPNGRVVGGSSFLISNLLLSFTSTRLLIIELKTKKMSTPLPPFQWVLSLSPVKKAQRRQKSKGLKTGAVPWPMTSVFSLLKKTQSLRNWSVLTKDTQMPCQQRPTPAKLNC